MVEILLAFELVSPTSTIVLLLTSLKGLFHHGDSSALRLFNRQKLPILL